MADNYSKSQIHLANDLALRGPPCQRTFSAIGGADRALRRRKEVEARQANLLLGDGAN